MKNGKNSFESFESCTFANSGTVKRRLCRESTQNCGEPIGQSFFEHVDYVNFSFYFLAMYRTYEIYRARKYCYILQTQTNIKRTIGTLFEYVRRSD